MLASRIRFIFGAMALALIVAVSSPVGAQQRNPDNSVNKAALYRSFTLLDDIRFNVNGVPDFSIGPTTFDREVNFSCTHAFTKGYFF